MKLKKGERYKVKNITIEEASGATEPGWRQAIGKSFTMTRNDPYEIGTICSQSTTLEKNGVCSCQNIPTAALIKIKPRKKK